MKETMTVSLQTHDETKIERERGHLWDEAIARFDGGERGLDASEAIEQVAARLDLKL